MTKWKLSMVGLVLFVASLIVFVTSYFIKPEGFVPISCLTNEQKQELIQTTPLQSQILAAAKERTSHKVTYKDAYYSTNGGKPPDNEGVCTDLFWRSMEGANVDFPKSLTSDMKKYPSTYPLEIWDTTKLDPLIDYRRVPNIEAYLEKYAEKLSTAITPCDMESLKIWQPGDIVIFKLKKSGVSDHIAIVSDKRDPLGIPYLIHHYGVGEVEHPGSPWFIHAIGHFRWKDK